VGADKRVLVHGAAVIATAFTRDLDYVRALGADQVIDVTNARFEDAAKEVDVVLDTVGGDTLERSFVVLRRGGVMVSSVAPPNTEKAAHRRVRGVFFLVAVTGAQLVEIGALIDRAELAPNVGEVLPLGDARLAHEMLAGKPHKRGKIILVAPE
jgi:NADPH:quinone reductase-like Zn-dependent oxidoreductase